MPTQQDSAGDGRDGEAVAVLQGVAKAFGDKTILRAVDLTIRRGEFVALLGASGSGKTTLLRILAELDVANGGRIKVTRARSVVFQEPRLLPFRRVAKNVVLGLQRGEIDAAAVTRSLEEVGLSDQVNRWPKSLSGGEAQRVALARALIREPALLLLDEPFAALDALTRLKMQHLVLELWRAHEPGVLFITHDVEEAILLADRILVLKDGELSLDRKVNVDRSERRAWDGFAPLRAELLKELGVTDG
jgi:sulfonate transport system ATP-binding protein